MSLRTVYYRSVHDIPADGLAALGRPATLYDSKDWLAYGELAAGQRIGYVGALDQHGRLAGLLALRTTTAPGGMPLYDLGALAGTSANEPNEPLYPHVVGAVSGAHCVLRVAAQATVPAAEVRRQLVTGAVDLADRVGDGTLGLLYLADHDLAVELGGHLAGGRDAEPIAPVLVAAVSELAGGWADFDEYVGTLAKQARTNVRRERREFAAAGLVLRARTGVAGLDERIAALQLNVRQHHGIGGSVPSILQDFQHLGATVGDRIVTFVAERDGRPVASCLCLVDGDQLHIRVAGLDYAETDRGFPYFNTVYYGPIEWGVRNGITGYRFGTGSYRTKLARGCRPRPRYGVIRWPAALRASCTELLASRAEPLHTLLTDAAAGAGVRTGATV
jgi:uncharacterized protein